MTQPLPDFPVDRSRLEAGIRGSLEAIGSLFGQLDTLEAASRLLVDTLRSGGKVLTCGNGGSAAEAMHMAEELSGRFRGNRRSLPGLALTADGTAITCIANDFGYDEVFARQIEGLGAPGDLLVVFSTSGKARCLARAVSQARVGGLRVLLLLGRGGGPLAGRGDVAIDIPDAPTERIQEAHQVVLHLLLDQVELAFPAPGGDTPR
ncbi:MAG: D-sedoheptulose-7-phosphate isomerase [Kiritimatiellia bacterium]|jgi:D-sedoheptulose 7-phosphate isomerase